MRLKWLEMWHILKRMVLERDGYICQKCGIPVTTKPPIAQPNFAEIDHIVSWRLNGKRWDLDNLQTLCHRCHKQKTRKENEIESKERSYVKFLQKLEQETAIET